MPDRGRAALAVVVEVLGVIVAIVGACWYALPLGLVALGLALIYYVAPLVEANR